MIIKKESIKKQSNSQTKDGSTKSGGTFGAARRLAVDTKIEKSKRNHPDKVRAKDAIQYS